MRRSITSVGCSFLVLGLLSLALGVGVGCEFHEKKPALHRPGEDEVRIKIGDGVNPLEAPAGVETPEARGKRFFLGHVRKLLHRRLSADGFALVEGDEKPLATDQIVKLLEALDDESILHEAHETGAIDGETFKKPSGVWDWVKAHFHQMAALIKRLMGLLALV
jgi:hypothetical protein